MTKVSTALTGVVGGDVFWAPTGATSLGANSIFKGTIIDAAGISIGDTVNLEGRALAFGGTVGTNHDTIFIPTSCSVPPSTCSVFTYSAWGTCSSGSQSRTVSTSLPSGCTGGSPILTQSCTVVHRRPTIIVAPIPPLIDVTKIPTPLALPLGPESVTYNYVVSNIGTVAMSNVIVKDNKCTNVGYISGDTNLDSKLDVGEIWKYSCTQTLSTTTTNTVTATGDANGFTAIDTASATVVVGVPVIPPLIHIVKIPSTFLLPVGGGAVTYKYIVTNPGTAPLSNVSVSDDKCTGLPSRVFGHPGDLNKNDLLESNESWSFTCVTNLTQTTTNIGTAKGSANGLTATDNAFVTVVVNSPSLPNTGLIPELNDTSWAVIVLAGVILALIVSLTLVLRKHKV